MISTVQSFSIPKQGTSLTDQLHQIETDIIGQNGLACIDLQSFASHVRAQTGKTITTAQANQILALVANLSSALNCS